MFRKPNEPNSEWEVAVAAVTRTQAHGREDLKPLEVKEKTSIMAVDKEN